MESSLNISNLTYNQCTNLNDDIIFRVDIKKIRKLCVDNKYMEDKIKIENMISQRNKNKIKNLSSNKQKIYYDTMSFKSERLLNKCKSFNTCNDSNNSSLNKYKNNFSNRNYNLNKDILDKQINSENLKYKHKLKNNVNNKSAQNINENRYITNNTFSYRKNSFNNDKIKNKNSSIKNKENKKNLNILKTTQNGRIIDNTSLHYNIKDYLTLSQIEKRKNIINSNNSNLNILSSREPIKIMNNNINKISEIKIKKEIPKVIIKEENKNLFSKYYKNYKYKNKESEKLIKRKNEILDKLFNKANSYSNLDFMTE